MSRPHPQLYNSARWRRRTELQKQAHPMCEECELQGKVTAAELSHHIVEHNGDEYLFFYGALQSLCFACHLIVHGRAAKREFSTEIDASGWPIDGRHPVYRHKER